MSHSQPTEAPGTTATTPRDSINGITLSDKEGLDQNSLRRPSTKDEQGHDGATAATIDGNVEYLTGPKFFLAFGSVTLAAFLCLLDQTILGTATPEITSRFHSLPDVAWYAGAYQLTSAALQPLTGKIYTHFSLKWSFLVFFGLFELGSLICGVATSSSMLIGGRVIAGAGASGLWNGGMTIIAAVVPLVKRPLYTGVMIGIAQLGILLGPIIGGALTEYASWRWCFFINLPIGGLVGLLLFFVDIPDLTAKEPFTLALLRKVIPELDLIGFTLFAPTMIMFLLALQFGGGNTHAWDSATVIGLFCGAGALAIVFIIWELRVGERAMIPAHIVRRRIVWASSGHGAFLMANIFVASYFLPIYFQAVRGAGPSMSGVYTLPSICGSLLFGVTTGVLMPKFGFYLPWAVASGVVISIGSGLTATFSPTTSTAKWVIYQIIMGVGRGFGTQISIIAIQNALLPSQIPVGIAFAVFVQFLAGAISIVIATAIFTQSLVDGIAEYAPSVSTEAALAAGGGAKAVRDLVPGGGAELAGLFKAYAISIDRVFYMLAAFGVVMIFFAFGTGWVDIREKKGDVKIEEKTDGSETV
ncbi:efflux pump protein [Amniculicola lignicola CBS 123094]|uniref:Efflux pump protein n=1 Tax=Amniculicola lignicola CBS 123094 TaxID=1392246 RepID=A0A6A5WE53_9PLEO|nr:efflux pump protein [Amniculicola lignicola CBS 123094]